MMNSAMNLKQIYTYKTWNCISHKKVCGLFIRSYIVTHITDLMYCVILALFMVCTLSRLPVD